MIYVFALIVSFALSALLMPYAKQLAFKIGAVDHPKESKRKIHSKVMARAGGIGVFVSFVVIVVAAVHPRPAGFWGLLIAAAMVFGLGLVDDVRRLSPWLKLGVQLLAALMATVGFGIGIDAISNPFGNTINLNNLLQGWHVLGIGISASLVASLLAVVWLVAMTNTMNFLDGLDGLSGGVAAIAGFVMFLISLSSKVNQPQTALIAIVLVGACLGFLIFNFYPAKLFLGDSGAYFLGMTLGILAILSGAKLATAGLVLGLPLLDALWAAIRRILHGKSPFTADRGHLHFLLLDTGLSQRQAVFVIYAICVIFGAIGVYAGTNQKLIAFVGLILVMFIMLGLLVTIRYWRRKAVSVSSSK